MRINKRDNIDYIYWISLILFTNPGGIQEALGIFGSEGAIKMNDFLILVLVLSFMFVVNIKLHNILNRKLIKWIIIFFIYYFVIFGYATPLFKDANSNIAFNFIKLRFSFYSLVLFITSVPFFVRSWKLFIEVYIYSSLIILLLFIQSFLTGFDVLPREIMLREFTGFDRNFLLNYGLMPFLTQIGLTALIFRKKIKNKNLIIVGLLLMNLAWILSLTRRHILGLIITAIIVFSIFLYIEQPNLSRKFSVVLKSVSFAILFIIALSIIKPTYIEASIEAVKSTINIIQYGEDLAGNTDERLKFFGRSRMVMEFEKSPFFGTGFDNIWRGSEGEKYGYEKSDYHFQAALAMNGLIGILFFLPVYIFLIKMIVLDLRFLRKYKYKIEPGIFVLLVSIIVYFIFHLLQYVNWFGPVSNSDKDLYYIWYLLLGGYVALRELILNKYNTKKTVSN
ncbi:MAG: O-antigen ligase family protein [Melioribacteraceae bacterium]|nr:O-antigen ligase family protein [Melioribacteraceae bacterium]